MDIPEQHRKRLRRARRFLFVSIAIVAVYAGLYFLFPGIDTWIRNTFSTLQEYAIHNGLWGMFVFSLASNVTLFINVPYSSMAVLLGGLGLNPFSIALMAGLGAMLGEVTAYLLGYGGGRLISHGREEIFDRVRTLLETRRGLVPWLIFFLAATPVPDNILLIPLGVVRYSFWKMLGPMTLGKITQNFYFALIGYYSIGSIDIATIGSGFAIGLVSLVLMLGAIYFVLRVDWDQLIERWSVKKR